MPTSIRNLERHHVGEILGGQCLGRRVRQNGDDRRADPAGDGQRFGDKAAKERKNPETKIRGTTTTSTTVNGRLSRNPRSCRSRGRAALYLKHLDNFDQTLHFGQFHFAAVTGALWGLWHDLNPSFSASFKRGAGLIHRPYLARQPDLAEYH